VKRFVHTTRFAGPGEILSFTVHCPAGWIEISGTIVSNPSALPVLRAAPRARPVRGISRWTFAFDNRGSSQPAEVRVRIACLKLPPPGGKRRRGRLRGGRLRLNVFSGRTERLEIRRPKIIRSPLCPRRMTATGRGIEVEVPNPRAAWASTRPTGYPFEVSKAWFSATKRGDRVEYALEATGPGTIDARVSVLCVERTALAGPPAGPPTHRYPIKVSYLKTEGTVNPGSTAVKALCPQNSISVATGHLFPPGSGLSVFRSFPAGGRAAIFEIDSPAAGPEIAQIQAGCLDTRPHWRRIR